MCGLGGEIARAINELAFDELDAPPRRLQSEPVSHPFAPVQQQATVVNPDRIAHEARDVIKGQPPVPRHRLSQRGGRPALVASPIATPAVKPTAVPAPVSAASDDVAL